MDITDCQRSQESSCEKDNSIDINSSNNRRAVRVDSWMHGDSNDSIDGVSASVASRDLSLASSTAKTLTETCAIAENLGNMNYPQFAKMQFLEVLARDSYVRPLVVLYGCRLPTLSSSIQKELIAYIKETLDVLVEQEYDAIYFNYGTSSLSLSSFSMLKHAYSEFDRKYKKNIKTLYLIHPSRTMLAVYGLFKGFISKKFERKLKFVKNLSELQSVVNLELMHIPISVKNYDINRHQWSEFDKPLSQVSLNPNGVPYLVEECVTYLRTTNATSSVEGIFRRPGSVSNQKTLALKYSVSPESFEIPPGTSAADAAGLLKQFINRMSEPILSFGMLCLDDYNSETICQYVRKSLAQENKATLYVLFSLFEEIISHSNANLMNAENLAKCIAPSLGWSELPNMEDLDKMFTVFDCLLQNYRSIFVS